MRGQPLGSLMLLTSLAAQEPAAPEPGPMHLPPAYLQIDGAIYGVHADGLPDLGPPAGSVLAPIPAGTYQFRFPAGGGGRPENVTAVAPDDGFVAIAVEPPPRPTEESTHLAADFGDARTFGTDDSSDVRVHARVRFDKDGAPAGIACRWQDADNHYRFVWDPARKELRLERCMGKHTLLLQKTKAPGNDGAWHTIELQASGFRLAAFFDDAQVARVLDGALERGRYGTWLGDGATVTFGEVTAAPPARPQSVVVAVTTPGHTEVAATAPEYADSVFALCLKLDRPMPLWPVGDSGLEIAALQRLVEPIVLLGFATGEVAPDGMVRGAFDWPRGPALRLHAGLVGGWLGAPDAESLRARLPWAAVRF